MQQKELGYFFLLSLKRVKNLITHFQFAGINPDERKVIHKGICLQFENKPAELFLSVFRPLLSIVG